MNIPIEVVILFAIALFGITALAAFVFGRNHQRKLDQKAVDAAQANVKLPPVGGFFGIREKKAPLFRI